MSIKKLPRRLGKNTVRVSLVLLPTADCAYYTIDIWYNKWAGGDREDNYSKCVLINALHRAVVSNRLSPVVRRNLKRAAT